MKRTLTITLTGSKEDIDQALAELKSNIDYDVLDVKMESSEVAEAVLCKDCGSLTSGPTFCTFCGASL